MELKKAHFYAWLSFWVSVVSLVFTFLFSMTLFYQVHRDENGKGVYVLPQFLSRRSMLSNEFISTSTFEKGKKYRDNDYDRLLIEEMLIRYYLEMRYTFFPDVEEMVYRWGWRSPLRYFSTNQVHQDITDFEGKGKGLSDDDLKQKIHSMQHVIKTVEIEKISKKEGNRYEAEILVYSLLRLDGRLDSVNRYLVQLNFRYSNLRKFYTREFSNPYGLYFTDVVATLIKE